MAPSEFCENDKLTSHIRLESFEVVCPLLPSSNLSVAGHRCTCSSEACALLVLFPS